MTINSNDILYLVQTIKVRLDNLDEIEKEYGLNDRLQGRRETYQDIIKIVDLLNKV